MLYLPSLELTHLQMSSPPALPQSHTGEGWQFTHISQPYYLLVTRLLLALNCLDPVFTYKNTCALHASLHCHVLAANMANRCIDSEEFYRRLEELKSNSKNNPSPVDIYIDESFYQKAYQWLKAKAQNDGNSITID